MGIAATQNDPNCMVLKAFNYFGSSTWYTNPSACFTHLLDSVNNLNIYYTNESIIGLAFDFDDGTNESYIQHNSSINAEESINLRSSYIIGVDVWIASGINGLQFKLSENKNTSIMGSTNGCNSFLNSTYVNSKYFKIDSISVCKDDKNSTDFSSIGFYYSFSQCPFIVSSSAMQSSSTTRSSTIVTTTVNPSAVAILSTSIQVAQTTMSSTDTTTLTTINTTNFASNTTSSLTTHTSPNTTISSTTVISFTTLTLTTTILTTNGSSKNDPTSTTHSSITHDLTTTVEISQMTSTSSAISSTTYKIQAADLPKHNSCFNHSNYTLILKRIYQ
jgi:hypothetical protein